jgi:flagellin
VGNIPPGSPSGSTGPFGYTQGTPGTGHTYAGQNVAVIQDISANQFTIQAADFEFVNAGLQSVSNATEAQTVLNGAFQSSVNYIGTALNSFAASAKFIENQITFNNALSDATTQGLGSLVDADLAKQSAKLQSLQIKQQLGTQSLGIANQTPQSLLGLFR